MDKYIYKRTNSRKDGKDTYYLGTKANVAEDKNSTLEGIESATVHCGSIKDLASLLTDTPKEVDLIRIRNKVPEKLTDFEIRKKLLTHYEPLSPKEMGQLKKEIEEKLEKP